MACKDIGAAFVSPHVCSTYIAFAFPFIQYHPYHQTEQNARQHLCVCHQFHRNGKLQMRNNQVNNINWSLSICVCVCCMRRVAEDNSEIKSVTTMIHIMRLLELTTWPIDYTYELKRWGGKP